MTRLKLKKMCPIFEFVHIDLSEEIEMKIKKHTKEEAEQKTEPDSEDWGIYGPAYDEPKTKKETASRKRKFQLKDWQSPALNLF